MIQALDLSVATYFSSVRGAGPTEYLYLLTTFFDVSVASLSVVLFIAILIYLVRGIRWSILFVSTLVAGAVIDSILKVIFNRARPTDQVITAFGKSFPSYHAVIVTIFFGMLMYIFDSYLSRPMRIFFNTFCVLGIVSVSVSRLYLGVHWLSDVVGGVVVGVCICVISVYFFNRIKQRNIKIL